MFSSLDGDGYRISEDFPPLAKSDGNAIGWIEEIIPSHVTLSGYPERKYSARIVHQTTYNDGILLGYDMGFHPSSREYVKNFMNLGVYHGQSHGDNGGLSISIPDQRGRIVFDDDKVSIEGDGTDICLVGKTPNKGSINIKQTETIAITQQHLN